MGIELVVFDVDSTLIQAEIIDLLAVYAGKVAEVSSITAAAMQGEIDFEQSLLLRVTALRGVSVDCFSKIIEEINFTEGVLATLEILRKNNCKYGAVSGGFLQIITPLLAGLGFSFIEGNSLEIKEGKLTGKLVGKIIDPTEKRKVLQNFALAKRINLANTAAVGDGANDIEMIKYAGTGIAFNAKPALQKVANFSINNSNMTEILPILGY